jgi:hypothetical protein
MPDAECVYDIGEPWLYGLIDFHGVQSILEHRHCPNHVHLLSIAVVKTVLWVAIVVAVVRYVGDGRGVDKERKKLRISRRLTTEENKRKATFFSHSWGLDWKSYQNALPLMVLVWLDLVLLLSDVSYLGTHGKNGYMFAGKAHMFLTTLFPTMNLVFSILIARLMYETVRCSACKSRYLHSTCLDLQEPSDSKCTCGQTKKQGEPAAGWQMFAGVLAAGVLAALCVLTWVRHSHADWLTAQERPTLLLLAVFWTVLIGGWLLVRSYAISTRLELMCVWKYMRDYEYQDKLVWVFQATKKKKMNPFRVSKGEIQFVVSNIYQDFDATFLKCLLIFATQTCLIVYYFFALEVTIKTVPDSHLICSAVLVQLFAYHVHDTGVGSSFLGVMHVWTLLRLLIDSADADADFELVRKGNDNDEQDEVPVLIPQVWMYCTHTLYLYTVLIHCTHTLHSYTVLIHCTNPAGP